MRVLKLIVDGLASYGLAIALLLLLFLLTLLGTLEQVEYGLYEVQKKYFESFYLVHWFGPVPLPLPGATLCLALLAVNIACGGLVRIRKRWSTAGVMVIHVGILIMLAAGLVKLRWSDDGALRLYETEASDEYESYYLWEVAIFDPLKTSDVEELLVGDDALRGSVGPQGRTLSTPELPFDVTFRHFTKNAVPMQKGPMWEAELPVIRGWTLRPAEEEVEAERNLAGVYVEITDRKTGQTSESFLWGVERHPWTFEAGGRSWAMTMRHKRFLMPFTIRLDDFTKTEHPGTAIARSYMSDVTKFEDGSDQKIRIQMNEPLRHGGLVLFQSSWGPQNARPGDPLFSVFSVVRNPSDYWPLISLIVTGVGLLIAFVTKLSKYARSQAKKREKAGLAEVHAMPGAPETLSEPDVGELADGEVA